MRLDSRWRTILRVVAVAFVLRAPAVRHRFYSNDEATYSALTGKILSGATMYAGAIDHRPPGLAYLYAGVFHVAGLYDLFAVRLLTTAIVALTGVLLAELAVSLTGVAFAGTAGLFYVLISATGFAPNTQAANTELLLNLPLSVAAIAMLACVRESRLPRAWLLACCAGAATGVAALFKYQASLAGVAWLLWLASSRRRPAIVAGASGLALGFAIVAAALVGAFAAGGHLDAFLFWGWRYNFQYIAALPLRTQAIRFVVEATPLAALWLPAIVLAASARQHASLGWWWLAAMGLAVSVGGRFFGTYFLMLTPPLAVLAGLGAARLNAAEGQRVRSLVAAAIVLAAVSSVAAMFWDRVQPSEHLLDAKYHEAGDWIRVHSSPGDTLLVWGDSPQIYVYSTRLMATRFAFTNYQTGTMWGIGAWPGGPAPTTPEQAVPRSWDELLADLHTSPPRLIADAAAGGLHNFEGQSMDHFARLWKIVTSGYRYETTAGGVRIYRRVE